MIRDLDVLPFRVARTLLSSLAFFTCFFLHLSVAHDASKPNAEQHLAVDGSILPFPPTPSASIAGLTMQDSIHNRRVEPRRLSKDAPNILIILMDDVGPGTPSTYGGEINTPTLSRVAKLGVSYNRFHSTAMCSPTRAALLCGRNHTRVGNGQIAELSNDWDGFSGLIPKSSATVAEVLRCYGYSTGAWGKWHNTPSLHTTSQGPFDYWPSGYGFEYFYGFLAGEASQYEPQMVRNNSPVRHRLDPGKRYHLTEDISADAVRWLREQESFAIDKPFLMYWAPGASHGPHQVWKEWADKYKGKFDDGWDKYRERTFARQKQLGWIPKEAKLTPRAENMASWDSIPEVEKPFQRRLMEVFAGFTEHADFEAGKVIDEIERQGKLDNTLIFYIWGDNGSSAEGQNGTISELLAQNGIPTKIEQHIKALEDLGGLDALGTAKTDNMYHAGWAWAGATPYRSTKLVGAHFGGTRQPMAVSWPKRIKSDGKPRSQFHHVVDIVPTIYEVTNITPPRVFSGISQDSIDGVSLAYSFSDPDAKGQKKTQFFDIMASRGIYHDGWYACAFGPRSPWVTGLPPGIETWTPMNDKWELFNLNEDWTQANDLSASMPEKLEQMKALFLVEAAKNKDMPIGGGLWTGLHPEDRGASPATEWTFRSGVTRMPEFTAPKLGNRNNLVSMELEIPDGAKGVLYSLGGFSGGLACYVQDGYLCYEYNMFEIIRTQIKSKERLPMGMARIEVETKYARAERAAPLDIVLKCNGKEMARGQVPISIPLGFTANDCLDIGSDLGSPVSKDYYEDMPFEFNGKIGTTTVKYVK
jgi:arylsulfatase A-like enzyme